MVSPPAPTPGDPESLARALEADERYRVLRRLEPRTRYAADDGTPRTVALAVDVETTGLDPRSDRIIQLALLPFEYGRDSGLIYSVHEPLAWLEDPGRPIPAEITALTGITDADVAGQRIDDAAVAAAATNAALVIAHNAEFDRGFLERRLPLFRERPWACSAREVPWRLTGHSSSSLEFLLMRASGHFFDAHRADADVTALVHLLTTALPDGSSALAHLLRSARLRSHRIWAVGAPIERKDQLKARKYRWNNGEDGRPRAWHREVAEADSAAELEWLREAIYGGRDGPWKVETLDARSRYSDRSA